MVVRLAIDTSFFIFLVRRRINMDDVGTLFSHPVVFYTSAGVINELKHISESNKSASKHAALALKYIRNRNIQIIDNSDIPDRWLLSQDAIATVDINLIRIAKNKLKPKIIITASKSNKIKKVK